MSDKPTPVALGPLAFARWLWRQLTSMRTALILLLLLALGSIPGSLIPQDGVDPNKSALWREAHPGLTPIYRKLDLFSVYNAPWFAAIYLLLMISLVGCIIPRLFVYAKAIRAQPPRTPKNLGRFADSVAFVSDDAPEVILDRAAMRLRRSRLRRDDPTSISAERGYLREVGNLLFHVSIIIVLVGFAVGQMFAYKGAARVRVGEDPQGHRYGFANDQSQYVDVGPDGLPPHGSLWKPSMLDPFALNVDSFTMDWSKGELGGDFDAQGSTTSNGITTAFDLRVNHPLKVGSTDVFLVGHGYAPTITLRPVKGDPIVMREIFETVDGTFHSRGIYLAASNHIAITCDFFPVLGPDNISSLTGDLTFHGRLPRGAASALSCRVYAGDLGSTNAVQLDPRFAKAYPTDGRVYNLSLPNSVLKDVRTHSVTLPDNLGTLSFDSVGEYVQLQISHQPGREVALGGVVLALIGLMGSLFIRPRRVWVRATRTAGGTLVEIAALDRSGGDDTADCVNRLMKELQDV